MATLTADCTVAVAGKTATVTDASTTDGTNPITGYSTNWGDMTTPDTTASPSHTYTAPGLYVVSHTVTDSTGATSTTYMDVATITTRTYTVTPAGGSPVSVTLDVPDV